MRRQAIAICTAGLLWILFDPLAHAQTVTSIGPRTCKPGQTTQLNVSGKGFDSSLRFATVSGGVDWQLGKVEPTHAVVAVSLPDDQPLGPLSVWLTSASGSIKQQTLWVDDLDLVLDNGKNHSMETAQLLPTLCTVDGFCNASLSDIYQIRAVSGQQISFEVHTQQLRSAMDPVVRLLDASGVTLYEADDDHVGPDCKFSYEFATEGDFYLEIQDSRNSSAGSPYQLRIGDFPLVNQCYPLAVRVGEKTKVGFTGPDAGKLVPQEVEFPESAVGATTISVQFDEGKSSTWASLLVSEFPQFVEGETDDVLTFPIGISGRLSETKEVDSYLVQGVKGQSIRVSSKTRSLGSPTLLQMKLFNAAGKPIAETKVTDADEWSFDATFPDDGEYRLELTDLLRRGGDEFSYWVQVAPARSFTVALKADAKAREEFAIELEHGACALDLQISRVGFDGEIDLSQENPDCGIRVLNPRIAAKAKTARIYLRADASWKPDSFQVLRLVATAASEPELHCFVDSHALHRVKEPFILRPAAESDGAIVLAAGKKTDSPFAMKSAAPVQFARPLNSYTAVMTLSRIEKKFKAGVEVLPVGLPSGWSVSSKASKETYTLTMKRKASTAGEPEQLPLLVYGDFNGRGRIETHSLPVQWIDPVKVSFEFSQPLLRGGQARGRVRLVRQGNDPQPVTITFADLPAGITGPKTIAIAADQTEVEFVLQIGSDAVLDAEQQITMKAASKFTAQDFTVASTHPLPAIVESPQQLEIYPNEIKLHDPRGRQQFVVTGVDGQQSARDWSRHASFVSSNPKIAEVRNGVVYPIANGTAEIVVQVGSRKQTIPVSVSHMAAKRSVEFESEVLVALSKQGCNSGACHGSPSGKGGFRLSLRAFDKKLDQLTLIREDFGRRVNTLDPEQSLLLLKPTMKLSHGGGKQLRKSDAAYGILRDWIAGGAGADPDEIPRVTRLEVYPSRKQILALADGGQQLAVTAHFADGRQRDVTHLVAYETSDTSVATVDVHGFVTPHDRGEVAVLVRLLEYIESVPLMFVENLDEFQWKSPPPNNYVDELVNAKLQQLQYLPAETCSDEEFLRRVNLDLLGILPTVEETKAFLAEQSKGKRSRLIDLLLQRNEYSKFWALKWGDLLKMTGKLVGDEGVYKYHRWVEQSLHNNMPYDEFARQLLTGTGSTLANPPANFYRTSTDMNECVETISQVFLGARLQCAKCHNHPFERWTQDNYYGLGAFFHRVQRRKTGRPGEMFIYTNADGDVRQPRTGQVMSPWLPVVGTIEPKDGADQREDFADWLVNPDNPYFARIEANRIWSQLFARGIVDPIDDFRDSNPPTNGPLLDALAKDFVESGYDRKHLLRVILNSRTYQASYQTTEFNREDAKYCSHQEPRLLGAEQLLDAINRTLDLKQKFGTLPAGTLATQLPAPDLVKVDFLKVFGQPERSTVCACERADDSNLGMAIELFNGPMIHEKIRDANNRFRKSLAAGKSVEEIVREIYLAAVCRQPVEIELKTAVDHCAKNPDPARGIEDICWALFNTDEFLFQH
ncbi:MAG: DUF1549 domain-containing protein [Rubripirellula sp.]